MFLELPLYTNAALFLMAAYGVWLAGTHLAVSAEELSDRKNLGKNLMGFVFLAAATELPEVVTTLYAAAAGEARLLLNNMFGGIALQTALLAIADIVAVKVAITRFPRKPTPLLEGALLILILSLLLGAITLGEVAAFFHIGLGVILLASLYVWIISFCVSKTGEKSGFPSNFPNLLRAKSSPACWLKPRRQATGH